MKLILLLLLLAACVNMDAMTEEEKVAYLQKKEDIKLERAEQLAEAYDEYVSMARACRSGGNVVVRDFSESDVKHKRVDKWQLKRAGCMSPQDMRNIY